MPSCVCGWNPREVPFCHSDRAFRLSLTDRSQANRWIEVKAKGPVSKILKLIPAAKPVFPIYRDLVSAKDSENA